MGRLQIHVDDPLVEHLAKCAQQNDGVAGGIVVVTFQNVAECCPRIAVHQIVVHRALEPFELTFVPGHENLGILDIGADLQTRAFEVTGMELRRVIDDHEFWYPVAFPPVLDRRKVPRDIGLRENRVLQASHHRQAARRFESSVEAHWTTSVLIEGGSDRRPAQRQHATVVHYDDVAGSVVHRYTLQGAGSLGPRGGYPEFHFGAAFAVTRHHDLVGGSAAYLAIGGPLAWNRKPVAFRPQLVCLTELANNFQMYFWYPLALSRHVQLVDNPIGD